MYTVPNQGDECFECVLKYCPLCPIVWLMSMESVPYVHFLCCATLFAEWLNIAGDVFSVEHTLLDTLLQYSFGR